MKRTLILCSAVVAAWLGLASISEAQVYIRAPFVRVVVGDGVSVKAPFVRINTGEFQYPPYIYGPYPPPVMAPQPFPPAPQPIAPPPQPMPPQPLPPLPLPKEEIAPPLPLQPGAQVLTLEQFAKTFQPKAGTYEVTLLNPISKQPAAVRFTLPEGAPKRVNTNRDSIEFVYGIRHFVRIEFDRDGAIVTSR